MAASALRRAAWSRQDTALRRLRQWLAEKRIVAITVGSEASGTIEVPFLGGTAAVATGPPKLAAATGAALLLAHTVATAPGRFAIIIEPAPAPGTVGPAPIAATLAHIAGPSRPPCAAQSGAVLLAGRTGGRGSGSAEVNSTALDSAGM